MESGIGAASISVCCQQRDRDTETQRHGEACDGEWNRSSLHLCVLSTERHRDTETQSHRDMERHVMESGIGAASISVCCQQRHRDTETQRHRDTETWRGM